MEVDRRHVRGEPALVDPVLKGVADRQRGCSNRVRTFVRRAFGSTTNLEAIRRPGWDVAAVHSLPSPVLEVSSVDRSCCNLGTERTLPTGG